jgi:DNA-binding transcriptional regulator YhcF (GntR family)
MKIRIDRDASIPIRAQIRGAIEHQIAFGALAVGAPLPSVRDLAEQAGVAPMTISKIYADLQADGLIEGRRGAGTFVAESPLAAAAKNQQADGIRSQIDRVIDHAVDLGLRPVDMMAMVNARMIFRLAHAPLKRIVMVGLFADATASYADRVEQQVGTLATVEPVTLGSIRENEDALQRVRNADLVLTFSNLQADVEALANRADVISLRFIPSENTRMALASLDPLARVAVVSRFTEFQPILMLGFRRFAAHVENFMGLSLDTPDLAVKLAACDVLVMSTGADDAARQANPSALKIEYRHIPDPGDIDRVVMPLLKINVSAERSRKEAS